MPSWARSGRGPHKIGKGEVMLASGVVGPAHRVREQAGRGRGWASRAKTEQGMVSIFIFFIQKLFSNHFKTF